MVLAILAAVWLVILAPSAWKKLSGRRAGTSIDLFHHELNLLEHTGPKLVSPAFRLQTADAPNRRDRPTTGLPTVTSMPGRPSLVLLEPNVELEEVEEHDASPPLVNLGLSQHGAGRSGPLGAGERPRSHARGGPNRARHRRRVTLGLLVGVVGSTGALGFDRPFRLVWVVAGAAGAVLVAYVALALYAQWLGLLELGRRHSPPAPVAHSAPAFSRARGGRPSDEEWPAGPDAEFASIGRRARHAAGASRRGGPSTQPDRWAQFEEFYAEVGDDQDWTEDLRQAAGGR